MKPANVWWYATCQCDRCGSVDMRNWGRKFETPNLCDDCRGIYRVLLDQFIESAAVPSPFEAEVTRLESMLCAMAFDSARPAAGDGSPPPRAK